ncbi:MAG TPA: hypothetical protein VM680_03215 [Verrucomicrobiae bacterium]|nr:hypothetical protein [Verrucomicrobiae bacterium]
MKADIQDDIKSGLCGDKKSQTEAIYRAYERYADPIAAFVSEKWITFDSDEVRTVVNDVFIELAKKVSDGTFKLGGSLESLLFMIARRRGTDLWRKKKRRDERFVSAGDMDSGVPTASEDEITENVHNILAQSPELAAAWRELSQQRTSADEAVTNEVFRRFNISLASLPAVQRKVAEVMAVHFGDVTDEEIVEELAELGYRIPLGSVKSARREIRRKFETLMNRKERTEPNDSRQGESS